MTLVTASLFTTVGMLSATDIKFELDRFLLRPTSLLILGYMIAYWGGFEVKLKRRLGLLKDISDFRSALWVGPDSEPNHGSPS